jgi:glycosyltransferase involved in cell wall biosynthesis
VALLGVIARLKGSRLVYKVEDIYPEIAVALGTFTERSIATRFFSFVSRLLLEQADRVITLDDAMARRLREAGARDVETIPNWGDGDAIRPYPAAGQVFRDAYGLGDRFIVLYSGNMGRAHRFDAVVSAARECAGPRPDILFLFVGAGARFEEVRRATADLENVRFMGYQPREMLCALYAAADIHLVTLDDAAAGLLFPSKYAGALAAGKPVLLVGGLDAPFAGEIRQAGLGWAVPHSTPRVTGAIVDAASATSHQLELYGRNARRVFDAVYSKTRAMQRWDDVLNAAIGRERAATDAREAPVLKKARAASAR